MTLISIQKVKCRQCKSIFERPKLYSFHIGKDKESNQRVARLLRDSQRGCPFCKKSEVAEINILDNILIFSHLKRVRDEYHDIY